MNVLISKQELEAIDAYLKQAKNNELHEQLQYAAYTPEEIDFIFPALNKLLDYGARENKKLARPYRRHNYGYMHKAGQNNPRHTFILVLTYTQVLDELLSVYRVAQAKYQLEQGRATQLEQIREREWLYSLSISEMTGAQYIQFRKLIGG